MRSAADGASRSAATSGSRSPARSSGFRKSTQAGPAIAKEIIIPCRRYTAEELLPMGLLNRVVKKEELYPTVREMARGIAAKNPVAVMGVKATVNAVSSGGRALRLDLLLDRN